MLRKLNEIRWGIIGCGNVVKNKSGGAFNIPGKSCVCGVASRSEDKVRKYALDNHIPFFSVNPDELIESNEIDAIYIATPPSSHYGYAIKCIKNHKHIYVEKPLALTAKDCRNLFDLAQKYGVKIFTAFYRRALPTYRELAGILDEGEIGVVRYVMVRQERKYPDLTVGVPWRLNPKISGGGLFEDIAVHTFDLMDMYFGCVNELKAIYQNQRKRTEAADTVGVIANYENVILSGLWCFDSWRDLDCIEIFGSKGKMSFSMNVNESVKIMSDGKFREIAPLKQRWVQQQMVENVVDSILFNREGISTAENAIRVAEIIEKIQSSHI